MKRLTGNLILVFLFLLPLEAEGKEQQICDHGSIWCGDKCIIGNSCPSHPQPIKVVPLQKHKNTIYLMKKGVVVKCEDGKTLHSVHSDQRGTTHWSCGEGKEGTSQEAP